MSAADEILFESRAGIGHVTLNRPQAMNALTLGMIRAFDPQLCAWATDDAVQAVLIEGAGDRAFCAGGDIRALYDGGRTPGSSLCRDFYREEYILNRRIKRFSKPYVALLDGIVMGGGVGLSVHGSHRVASDRTLFAMPETGIGLFPDVGGTYFLPRCPGEVGMYLALTGARLKAADLMYTGIATHFIADAHLDAARAALATCAGGAAAIEAVLTRFAGDPGPPPLAAHRAAIDRCFAAGSVVEIMAALEAEGSEWAAATAKMMATKSPLSQKVTYRQIRDGAGLDFDAAMVLEYRLACRFMEDHDFFEGVRAIIIDKDNAPHWRPPSLADVNEAAVDAYFAPLGQEDLSF